MIKKEILPVVAAVLMLAACSQGKESSAVQIDGETVVLGIKGMNCSAWPSAIKAALDGVAGVRAVEMDFRQRTAKVVYDPGRTDPEILAGAVFLNGVFEASVLPGQHPTTGGRKKPEPRGERIPQEDGQEEQK